MSQDMRYPGRTAAHTVVRRVLLAMPTVAAIAVMSLPALGQQARASGAAPAGAAALRLSGATSGHRVSGGSGRSVMATPTRTGANPHPAGDHGSTSTPAGDVQQAGFGSRMLAVELCAGWLMVVVVSASVFGPAGRRPARNSWNAATIAPE
jgi:hypothetical protein